MKTNGSNRLKKKTWDHKQKYIHFRREKLVCREKILHSKRHQLHKSMYLSPSPLPPSHPRNLKDVTKTPTSILLPPTILETCASKAKNKKNKNTFPDNNVDTLDLKISIKNSLNYSVFTLSVGGNGAHTDASLALLLLSLFA